MTIILGFVDNGTVWMGADSFAGNEGESDLIKEPKIFKTGKMLIGDSGTVRPGQALRYQWKPPPFSTKGGGRDPIMAYLCGKVVPSMRKHLKKEDDESDIAMVVAIKHRLFEICGWGVMESRYGISAVGCGSDIAKGSLHSTKNRSPEKRIIMALEACQQFSPMIEGPWTIEHI